MLSLRHHGGVDVVVDGVVLRGQAEGVPADGEEHVVALHAALAGDDVHRGVAARMADVQPCAGGIGELDQAVKLGLVGRIGRLKRALLLPDFLPFRLDGRRIVGGEFSFLHIENSLYLLEQNNLVRIYSADINYIWFYYPNPNS